MSSKITHNRRTNAPRRSRDSGRSVFENKAVTYALSVRYKQRLKRNLFSFVLAFVVCGLFLFLLIRGITTGKPLLRRSGGAESFTVSVSVPGSKPKEISVTRGGTVYIDFASISETCGMTMIGGGDTASFVLPGGSSEYVSFKDGSSFATLNGNGIQLSGDVAFSGKRIYVPYDFLEYCSSGIDISVDEEKNTRTVSADGGQKISFLLKSSEPCPKVAGEESLEALDNLTFKTDLSVYEPYMNPSDRDAYLICVNHDNPVTYDYGPDDSDLYTIASSRYLEGNPQYMCTVAAKALEALLAEASANGYDDLTVTMGYANYWTQNWLFNTEVDRLVESGYGRAYAEDVVSRSTGAAGESEHQTGLCCDLHNIYAADKEIGDFAYEDAYRWLVNNCWKFGFIIRYPSDKQDITRHIFEPYHLRFVGRYHAYYITAYNITLEEYLKSMT